MATIKDRIIVGNTYSVSYDCFEPSEGPQFEENELVPSSAYVELYDVQNGEFLVLGSLGPSGTGAAASIAGNTVSYTVPSNRTTEAGDYKLYTTVLFPGNRTVTEVREYRVLDKQ